MGPRLAALGCAALVALTGGLAGCGGDGAADGGGTEAVTVAGPAPSPPAARGPGILAGVAMRLDGRPLALGGLRGRVVLLVNTASRCGYTPQYAGLEALYRERRDEGLAVVGVPSDDFGGQELEADREIAEFCRLNYGVSFTMLARASVTGPGAHPLYRAIERRGGPEGRPPEWNFTKYLIDRRGRLAARFAPSVAPDDPALAAAVSRLLAEPA